MKAVYFEKTGGIDVLQYGEFPTPRPLPGEALVRVRACALNRLDIWLRKERGGDPMPHIPGSDVSGVIEEINGKSSLQVGQEVVINPAIPCGSCPRCAVGDACEMVKILGAKTQGGYAEYVTVPITQIFPKPPRLPFTEAAAFPLTFLTAWHMLRGRSSLQAGETVFVWGASGGLGIAAVLIGKHLGAKVIAAARTEEQVKRLQELGITYVVLYTKEKPETAVKKMTGGVGVDIVFESVGAATWQTTLAIVRPFGRVVIAGTTSGDEVQQDLSDLYVRQLSIFGARMGTKEEFEKVLQLVGSGALQPVVDKIFPLHEAAKAQARMEAGGHIGKIILAP